MIICKVYGSPRAYTVGPTPAGQSGAALINSLAATVPEDALVGGHVDEEFKADFVS